MNSKKYNNYTYEQFIKIVGNELSFNCFEKLDGGDTHEKVTKLMEYRKKNTPNSYYRLKLEKSFTEFMLECVNHDKKIITIKVDSLRHLAFSKVKFGHIPVSEVTIDLVPRGLLNQIQKYVDKGYSLIFEHNGKQKILLYNS
jgi:hypothetical protein